MQVNGRNVLLFPDDDDEGTTEVKGSNKGTSRAGTKSEPDKTVAAGIERYLQKQQSSRKEQQHKFMGLSKQQEAAHTGIADDDEDDPDDDGEPDYDVMSRHTLKASRQALAEVLSEAKDMHISGDKKKAAAAIAAAGKPKR